MDGNTAFHGGSKAAGVVVGGMGRMQYGYDEWATGGLSHREMLIWVRVRIYY